VPFYGSTIGNFTVSRLTSNKLIAVIRTPRNFRVVLYNLSVIIF